MPLVTCRCGQTIKVPAEGADRIVCPACAARIRVRRGEPSAHPGDGYLRFRCACGRRLKVQADQPPEAGKCPDCGRVVTVPIVRASPQSSLPADHPEAPTEELTAADLAQLEQWAQAHVAQAGGPGSTTGDVIVAAPPAPLTVKIEAGLRVCPRCGKPVHMSALVCRACGAPVPKR
jgi:hypothetical protein